MRMERALFWVKVPVQSTEKRPIITREDNNNYSEAPSAGAMRGRGMRKEDNQLKQ